MTLCERRMRLGKAMPLCPKCNHEQVQLTDWFGPVAKWKCRICKHRFELEPKRL